MYIFLKLNSKLLQQIFLGEQYAITDAIENCLHMLIIKCMWTLIWIYQCF